MQLLLRHIEKLVLGLFLVGLLGCCWFLLTNLKQARGWLGTGSGMPSDGGSGALLPTLTAKEFDARDFIYHPRLEWATKGDEVAGFLFEPRLYIRCANPECTYLMPYDKDTCPYCNTKQGKEGKLNKVRSATGLAAEPVGEDNDSDGMPNDYEKKFPFLDVNLAEDADRDEDKDWFTNLQECEAKTSPADPKEHPPVATMLRHGNPVRKPLGIIFTKLSRNDPDNTQTWDIFVSIFERGKQRSRILRLGEQVGDYKILAVRYKTTKQKDSRLGGAEVEKDASEIDLQKANDPAAEPIVLAREAKDTFETGVTIPLMLLRDPTDVRRCPVFYVRGDENIVLKDAAGQTETYKILDPNPKEEGIQVQRILADGKPGNVLWIKAFDAVRDLLQPPGMMAPAEGSPADGGMSPGMMMGPGGVPVYEGSPPEGGMMMGQPGTRPGGMSGSGRPAAGGRRPMVRPTR